jgi:hypothetical protein
LSSPAIWRYSPLTRTRRKLLTCGFATPWRLPTLCAPRPSATCPWSLRDRLDDRDITDLITAYREDTTVAYRTAAHGLRLTSLKHLVIAGSVGCSRAGTARHI